jgi:hypothetical protein
VARVAGNRAGSWEPVFFGFLVVNSFFAATTALLVVDLGRRLIGGEAPALLAACLYLLNFETANILLSGMVDSADGCFLMAIVWSLVTGRVWWLPVWGVLGAASKETFVPICIVFAVVWWVVERRAAAAIGALVVALLASVTLVQSGAAVYMVWPWDFAAEVTPGGGHARALLENTLDRNMLFMAIWLVPLGVPRLRSMPMKWVAASGAAVVTAVVLATLHSSSAGAAARPIFNAAGPLLSLSAARYLDTRG